jgi:hypothetical protein
LKAFLRCHGLKIKGFGRFAKGSFSKHVVSYISGVPLYICNDNIYGFVMVPLEQSDSLELDFMQLVNLKLEVLGMYLFRTYFIAVCELHLISLALW